MIQTILRTRFFIFGVIGSAGFIIDTSIFYCLHANFGIAISRAISILTAMTFTWLANRTFTFQFNQPLSVNEWLRYFSVNGLGALINFSVFFMLAHEDLFLAGYFIIPLALATLISMWFNFVFSRFFVFSG
jgi:putative flippase GtrA